jgi:hypothetical protein
MLFGCVGVRGLRTDLVQETRQIFDAALSDASVERNNEGKIAVHGSTIIAWTSKVP